MRLSDANKSISGFQDRMAGIFIFLCTGIRKYLNLKRYTCTFSNGTFSNILKSFDRSYFQYFAFQPKISDLHIFEWKNQ